MKTCSWVLSLWMTIFLSNGTADLARQPDGMLVRTFMRKLFASTWAHTSRCWPASFAFCSGCCYVNAIVSSCPKEELAHVRRNALCCGQRYDVFRIITQNNPIQHATENHTHCTRSDNPTRGVPSWRNQCSQSRGLSTRRTHLPETIDMGGQRKNSRHKLHWHCRDAPVSSWHSATCCHTKLPNLHSCPAAISQMRCFRTSYGVSALLQASETHRSPQALCARTPARNPCHVCTKVLSMGRTKPSEGANHTKSSFT